MNSIRDGLLVFLGGGVGSVARYLVQQASVRLWGASFPAGTLAVNLVGSFLMGAAWAATSQAGTLSAPARLALTVGVLGGFTTYSSFNQETLGLFQQGANGLGVLYVLATLFGGLLAGLAGHHGARSLFFGA